MTIKGANLNLQSTRNVVKNDLMQLGRKKLVELNTPKTASIAASQDEDVALDTESQAANSQVAAADNSSKNVDAAQTQFYNTNKTAVENDIKSLEQKIKSCDNASTSFQKKASSNKATLSDYSSYQANTRERLNYILQENLDNMKLITLEALFGSENNGEKTVNSVKDMLLNDTENDHTSEIQHINELFNKQMSLRNELVEINQKRIINAYQVTYLAVEQATKNPSASLYDNSKYKSLASEDSNYEKQQHEKENQLLALNAELKSYLDEASKNVTSTAAEQTNVTEAYLTRKNELESQLFDVQKKLYSLVEQSSKLAISNKCQQGTALADLTEYKNIIAEEKQCMQQQAALEEEMCKLNAQAATYTATEQTPNQTTQQTNSQTNNTTNEQTTQTQTQTQTEPQIQVQTQATRMLPSQKSATKKKNKQIVFNPTYNQKSNTPKAVANSEETGELLSDSKSDSNKSWQNIIDDLNSKVDYGMGAASTNSIDINEMSFKELSAYFASKLSQDVISAGSTYYTKGKGAMFRYPDVKREDAEV